MGRYLLTFKVDDLTYIVMIDWLVGIYTHCPKSERLIDVTEIVFVSKIPNSADSFVRSVSTYTYI